MTEISSIPDFEDKAEKLPEQLQDTDAIKDEPEVDYEIDLTAPNTPIPSPRDQDFNAIEQQLNEKKLSSSDTIKFSILLAMADCIDDMDEYFLFFIVPMSMYGCDCTDWVFGIILLAKELSNIFSTPFSGWIVDTTHHHQHLTLIFSSVFQLLTAALYLFTGHLGSIVTLALMIVVHELTVTLNLTSMWKVINYRCEKVLGKDSNLLESQIGLIGTINEIISNFMQVGTMGLCYFCIRYTGSFYLTRAILLGVILASNSIITLISLTITRKQLYGEDAFPRSLWGDVELRDIEKEKSIDDDYDNGKKKKKRKSALKTGAGNVPINAASDEVIGAWTFFARTLAMMKGGWASLFVALKKRWTVLTGSRLILCSIFIGWLLYTVTEIVEYPLVFAEADNSVDPDNEEKCYFGRSDNETVPSVNTLDNFCGGSLTNLVNVAVLDNIMYTIGSFLYLFILLKMTPRIYYTYALPIMAFFLACLSISFWFIAQMKSELVYALMTSGDVIPYYLEKYNFYFWSSKIDSRVFGLFFSVYQLGRNFLYSGTAIILSLSPRVNSSSPLFYIILIVCFVASVLTLVSSLSFGVTLQSDTPQGLMKLSDDEDDLKSVPTYDEDTEMGDEIESDSDSEEQKNDDGNDGSLPI
eukprot:TRINITY_DN8025_c0_g1_i1.p1 TRINITY_DN8025_c0_g1~~TRINITY_DN8025_c0_g1_i1.p1  ORF type:complete len:640 (-),score=128.80 TRINITY_DN8025_c0_g1_i1:185-2104(-)